MKQQHFSILSNILTFQTLASWTVERKKSFYIYIYIYLNENKHLEEDAIARDH